MNAAERAEFQIRAEKLARSMCLKLNDRNFQPDDDSVHAINEISSRPTSYTSKRRFPDQAKFGKKRKKFSLMNHITDSESDLEYNDEVTR